MTDTPQPTTVDPNHEPVDYTNVVTPNDATIVVSDDQWPEPDYEGEGQ